MAKVLLLSPSYVDLYGNLKNAAGRYFPLGIGYIAAYLRKYGHHSVQMYEPEAQQLTEEDIAEKIRQFMPDIVGITCATPNFKRALKLASLCKQNSTAKTVFGGVHVSAMPVRVLEENSSSIDYVVIGEGEETMLELVDACQNGSCMTGIRGIAYMNGNKATVNASRPFIGNLDSLPFPARDLIPQHRFAPNLHNARHRKCLTILTSRGCPFNCSFCAARIVSGKKYRMHSAEYVLGEMELLKRDYGARQLVITDDTFTIDHARLENICKGMIDKRLKLFWFCFSQITTVNKEILSLMKRAGCYNIGFGLESSEKEILDRIGKSIPPEKAKEIVHIANRLGIKTQTFYILGFPGETRKQMENTIRFSQYVDSTLSFYNMLVPYPGTKEFEDYSLSVSPEDMDWEKFVAVGERCVVKNAGISPREIEKIIRTANIEYYSNLRRLARILFQTGTLYELINYIRAGFSLMRQIGSWGRNPSNAKNGICDAR